MSVSGNGGVEDSPHASDSTSPDRGQSACGSGRIPETAGGSTVAPGAETDPSSLLNDGGSPWLPARKTPRSSLTEGPPVRGLFLPEDERTSVFPVLSDRTAPLPLFPPEVPASAKVDFGLAIARATPTLQPETPPVVTDPPLPPGPSYADPEIMHNSEGYAPALKRARELAYEDHAVRGSAIPQKSHPVLGEETAHALNLSPTEAAEVTSAFSLLNANGTQHVSITVPTKYALATIIGASTVAGAFIVLLILTLFG